MWGIQISIVMYGPSPSPLEGELEPEVPELELKHALAGIRKHR